MAQTQSEEEKDPIRSATVTERPSGSYRVTIPIDVSDELDWEDGDQVLVVPYDEGIRMFRFQDEA